MLSARPGRRSPASSRSAPPTATVPGVAEPKVVIIGGGMSGMLMGIRLQKAGFRTFEILEKADAIGGTWRDNTYPGLACDVPGYLYTYSFEPNPECRRRYATGPEIRAYFERVYAKYELARHVRLGEEVTAARYEQGGWTVHTGAGRVLRADILISATGVLHHPKLPEIPGLDSFAGAAFHSARWNHDVPLDGKRIGVVGTGSTAVQIVCGLVDRVDQLRLFQRTAQWVIPAYDVPYSDRRRALLRRFPQLASLLHHGYSRYYDTILGSGFESERTLLLAAFRRLAERHLGTVRDPALRRRLTPDYRFGCKRFILSDQFYEAVQKPQTQLVDAGIERVEPRGVRTKDGVLHELDVLVLATGFEAQRYVRPIAVTGQDGISLDQLWAHGVQAYRSVALPGFPNFFMLQGPHSPIGNYSLIKISETQSAYIMRFVEQIRRGSLRRVAPRAEPTARFNEALRRDARRTIWASSGCRSWYLDPQGNLSIWPWSIRRFDEEMKAPRINDFELHA